MVRKAPDSERPDETATDSPRATDPVISGNDVALWQGRMGLNDQEAMAALGIGSRHTWAKMKREGAGRMAALAMGALIRGHGPWPE